MSYADLKDLVTVGVDWELSDTPFLTIRTSTKISDAERQKTTNPFDAFHRIEASVVPPIVPGIQTTVETAASMAMRPQDIFSLKRMIAEFNHPLRASATNVVLPDIADKPNGLLIITDMPSVKDDENAKILSDNSGELLDKMLKAINMTRENVSVLPLIFWRTPGGRSPTKEELELTRPFVNRAIELLKPKIILTLGTLTAMEIANVSLQQSNGKKISLDNGILCVPIFHPNYLSLKPSAKRDAWTALQNIEKLLKNSGK